MNDLFFNWHKRLNIKKVVITILIVLITILLVFFLTETKSEESKKENSVQSPIYNPTLNTTIFFDKNNTISLELSNDYLLKQYTPNNSYLLELRSEKNLNIFISQKELFTEKKLEDVVSADKLAFMSSFSTISNTSELKQVTINDRIAYTYSFHYLDENLNTTFYLQVAWLEIDDNYYIFDIEFPLNDLNQYTNIITDVLSNFKNKGI